MVLPILCSSSRISFLPAPWDSLPESILLIILSKLILLSDLVHFGAVCRHWRSVAKLRLQELNVSVNMYFNIHLPLLLIPTGTNSETRRDLFSVTHGGRYNIGLPVPYNKRCSGSSHGWLTTIDCKTSVITLINPFYFGHDQGTIKLPSFLQLMGPDEKLDESINYEYLISKAILSADPISNPDDYAVMVIYGDMRRLAFYSSGDEHWTYIQEAHVMFQDVIFQGGQFLAVNLDGKVYICDITSNPPKMKSVIPSIGSVFSNYSRRYIVATPDGGILQVVRLVESTTSATGEPVASTYGFFIFKMVVNGVVGWVLEASLGNGSLFLGDNHSAYVDASRFAGCRGNCIYFTDDFHDIYTMHHLPYQAHGPSDAGIYNIKDHSIDPFYKPNNEQRHMPPPIWLLPTI